MSNLSLIHVDFQILILQMTKNITSINHPTNISHDVKYFKNIDTNFI